MDRARFPRDKVCAGWVTPGAFTLLELGPADYRATGLTIQEITGFRTSVIGDRPIETRYGTVISYAIRRCEFDDFLLRRASVTVLPDTPLTSLERQGDVWVVNRSTRARIVIGAGGHFCPVARHLRGELESSGGSGVPGKLDPPHVHVRPVVAKEAEFRVEAGGSEVASDTPELLFCRDLEGYGWCVRKGDYLNIGLGRRDHGDLNPHIQTFMTFLERRNLARRASLVRWRGHAYLASGTGPRPLVGDGILVVGDAAGLAYPESGEGIKPAIESGRLAAEVLGAARGRAGRDDLGPYEAEVRRRYPAVGRTPDALAGTVKALGRALMHSPLFTRRVLIDRWFLRSA